MFGPGAVLLRDNPEQNMRNQGLEPHDHPERDGSARDLISTALLLGSV